MLLGRRRTSAPGASGGEEPHGLLAVGSPWVMKEAQTIKREFPDTGCGHNVEIRLSSKTRRVILPKHLNLWTDHCAC